MLEKNCAKIIPTAYFAILKPKISSIYDFDMVRFPFMELKKCLAGIQKNIDWF